MKSIYPIQGMSCASCAASVESILKNTKGVQEASVNFANQTALVEYDPAKTGPEELRKSLQAIGYDLFIGDKENLGQEAGKIQTNNLKKIQFQTIGALVLSGPIVVIGMFFMDMPFADYLMLGLSIPVVFGFGLHFFTSAWKKARHGQANMDTLVALSTGIALAFSVFNTFFPTFWQQRGLIPHVYYEAASVIIAFISLGKWLEEKAKAGTSTAIMKLLGLQSKTVRVIRANGMEEELDIGAVLVGDIVVVKPGERIAVDGKVKLGSSFVDESSITGEPIPASKSIGDKVFAGTINQQGILYYVAEKVGNETVLAQIIKSVQEAQGSKAPVQKMVDKVANLFVPLVIGIALLTFGIWMAVGGENRFSYGLMSAVTVLVIACPCALGLATPTAIMVGIGKGAEQNILIKDAESLEMACQVNAIVFDKTGTITEGKPEVFSIHWMKEGHQQAYQRMLGTIESASDHPLAQAVMRYLPPQQGTLLDYDNFQNTPGKGTKMKIGDCYYVVGNEKWMYENLVTITAEVNEHIQLGLDEAKTVVYFARESEVLAVISIGDTIKKSALQAISELKILGLEVYMLTGDNEQSAKHVAKQVGISHYKGDVLPSEKADFVKQLQSDGKIVAMVGDGINDSEALARANVSIAMGKGSDIAIDVSKITLLTSDLLAVPKALNLSVKTVKTIRQNLLWAFVYNLIGIPIAAGALFPIGGILMDPMMASAAMALSSISVVANSMRLRGLSL
jgi:Cu2+-exporting ATPase